MSCYMGWCSLGETLTFWATLAFGYILGKMIELGIKLYRNKEKQE